MKEILVSYWKEEEEVINFGENIVEILIDKFGYRACSYKKALKRGGTSKYDSCLFMIGTHLTYRALDPIKTEKILVWGTGAQSYSRVIDMRDSKTAKKIKIFAVRGPLTKKVINCAPDIPVGDPGFLLPLFFPVEKDPSLNEVVYVPHHSLRKNIVEHTPEKLKILGAEKYIDVMGKRKDFWTKLKEIASARFVLTSSLHAAIIAHAYGVPWALCLMNGERLTQPFKWRDVYEYLGIRIKPFSFNFDRVQRLNLVRNYREGMKWYERVNSKGKIPDRLPLLKSFPFPVKNENVLTIMKRNGGKTLTYA